MITAFAELQRLGHFGPEALRLVQGLMSEEMRRFPAIEPAAGWQRADVEDLVQDFLEQRFAALTTMLLTTARNDESMGRLLRRSIRNWLIDRARKTGTGRVRQLLERVLGESTEFEQVPPGQPGAGQWRLARTSSEPWSGDHRELIRAADAVRDIRIGPWSSTTRRAPVAARDSLIAVARAVLSAAGGSVEIAQLTHVFLMRFPVALDWAVVPLDAGETERHADVRTPEEQSIAECDEIDSAGGAAEIAGMLTPQERALVPHLDDVEAAQRVLSCRRSSAYHQMKRLREKLTQLAGVGDDRHAVILEVIRLCPPPSD
ncbi:hypothetical protein [Labedaea rhizosphaerae]|uniref:Uncharacterized protein n=1 Tax=Labedaea rhizosphaerae TaxID=598644 RepID=A0A4R6SE31_LABRH|nr:hypothetical protein [Labedaea rhizosphaerae]TDP98152.1 hypothetical protein EV186_1031132 [Labedaea rhizosphaerae]